MSSSLTVDAPAKVNLFLSVGRPHPNGYHPIRTMFQAISLCDRVHLEAGGRETAVTFDVPGIPTVNTVSKTLAALAAHAPLPPLQIRVEKRVPSEAGLGGGSSDAAAVIRGLQAMGLLSLPESTLHDVARSVGADVPFFLVGGRARAEGYGEVLTPLPDAPEEWLVVARPDVACPTPQMYRALDSLDYPWREFPEGDELYNDFERVAPCESIELIERLLVHGAKDAALSGSGSAVFGRYPSRTAAERAEEKLRAERVPFLAVATTMARKPLPALN